MERDDVSSRTMVLCVSSVTVTQEDKEKNAEQSDDQGEKDGQSRMKMEVSQSDVITVLYSLPPLFSIVSKVELMWVFDRSD